MGCVYTLDPDRTYHVAGRSGSGMVGHQDQHTGFGIALGGPRRSGFSRASIPPSLETKTIVLDEEPDLGGNS